MDELNDEDIEALIDDERLVEFDKDELIELDKELEVKLEDKLSDDIELSVLLEVLSDVDVIDELLFEIDELLDTDEIEEGFVMLDSNKEPADPIAEPTLTVFVDSVLLLNGFNDLNTSSIFISFGSVQSFSNIPFPFDICFILS